MPASLTKVITTATALELLGENYTYKTVFSYTGSLENGKLIGDLLVESDGDPTLGSKYFPQTAPDIFFADILKHLKRIGVQSVEGSIRVLGAQVSYSAPRLWEDMGNYYGASPQGFNWHDNTAVITLRSGEVGTECKVVSVDPDIKPYRLRCKAVAASHSKDSAYVYGLGEIEQWWIEGSIPQHRSSFKIKAALPKPQEAFVNYLMKYLDKEGVEIHCNRKISLKGQRRRTPIFTYQSPPLSQIIKVVNHKSNNLFADQLLLTLGKEIKGRWSWDNGNAVVREFWQDKIDFDTHFRLRDGSGLTPKNLVSVDGMVKLLEWMYRNSDHFDVYAASLARGGESGTLRSVFKNPDLKGRIIGKSGSFEGVLGYCGYATSLAGKKTAFCMISNNYLVSTRQVRMVMDDVITHILLEN